MFRQIRNCALTAARPWAAPLPDAMVRPCAAAGAHRAAWRPCMSWGLVSSGLLKQVPSAVHVLLRGTKQSARQSFRHGIMHMYRVCA